MKKLNLVLGVVLASAMTVGLAACGGGSSASSASSKAEPAGQEAAGQEAAGDEAGEGKVLNIYVWNEEFKSRVEDHYPGYEKTDATSGKIGDVTVNFIITPNDDNAYQNNLDEKLLKQESAAADDRIDLFLVEADYALKYVDVDYTVPLSELGISASDLPDQYKYTQDVVTDSNGNLKGSSWQGCPGLLIYNREIAKEVLGSDDPDEVQKAVADWDTFKATAEKMAKAGYYMTSSTNDAYRVFSNNVTSKWVVDGKINIDENIQNWVTMSKEMVDAKETNTYELWSEDWSKGFYPEGKVFCYFGPAWFIDFSMAADTEGSVGFEGGWGATEGPQGFYWGGTWMCVAAGTDNPTLCKDLILTMTADEAVLTDIIKADHDFVNNAKVVAAMENDPDFGDAVLGGQNALGKFSAGVSTVDLSNISMYDQACNEEFQNAMKNYFEGNASYEEALDLFYKAVVEKHPELTY